MYLVLTAGFVLWLGYGLLIGSWPVIAFNIANLAPMSDAASLSFPAST